MSGPRSLTLEDPDGVQRSVTAEPQPFESYSAAVRAIESDRPSGTLAGHGAPDLYHLNMNSPWSAAQCRHHGNITGLTAAGRLRV